MLQIKCPWCGDRAETEFSYGGEAGIVRPVDNAAMNDREWGDYVFMRRNTFGLFREQWVHAHGCRRWFIAERDTRTYDIQSYETFGGQSRDAAEPVREAI
ncbi:sarcosine oxidase subunit delta [Castellaniella caeni]|uniref:sarcosine oxidase subunit delta n=1 Tax=Castellaniella caeni TaxID=266123 RepID=UPI00083327E8|nr:sarcosine oxidase subunit delta [Castellaniella caeni]